MIVAVAGFLVPTATGWSATADRSHHADLAILAAEGLDDPERAFLLAHQEAFRRGALDPDRLVNAFNHTLDPSTRKGGAADFIEAEFNDAKMALSKNDAETAAYELGELTHSVLDLAQPMHTAGPDAIANAHHTNYENATFDHASELDFTTSNALALAPRVAAYALAMKSAARYDSLATALDAAKNEWSPDVLAITQTTLRDGIATARTLLQEAIHGAAADSLDSKRVTPALDVVSVVTLTGSVTLLSRGWRATGRSR